MDKEALRLYRERWKAVAEVEAAELRAMTMEEAWQQVNRIHRTGKLLSFATKERDAETEAVARRWAQLRAKERK